MTFHPCQADDPCQRKSFHQPQEPSSRAANVAGLLQTMQPCRREIYEAEHARVADERSSGPQVLAAVASTLPAPLLLPRGCQKFAERTFPFFSPSHHGRARSLVVSNVLFEGRLRRLRQPTTKGCAGRGKLKMGGLTHLSQPKQGCVVIRQDPKVGLNSHQRASDTVCPLSSYDKPHSVMRSDKSKTRRTAARLLSRSTPTLPQLASGTTAAASLLRGRRTW